MGGTCRQVRWAGAQLKGVVKASWAQLDLKNLYVLRNNDNITNIITADEHQTYYSHCLQTRRRGNRPHAKSRTRAAKHTRAPSSPEQKQNVYVHMGHNSERVPVYKCFADKYYGIQAEIEKLQQPQLDIITARDHAEADGASNAPNPDMVTHVGVKSGRFRGLGRDEMSDR